MHLEGIGRFWLRAQAFQSMLSALTTPLKEFLSFFIITHRMKIILVTALGPVSKLNEMYHIMQKPYKEKFRIIIQK